MSTVAELRKTIEEKKIKNYIATANPDRSGLLKRQPMVTALKTNVRFLRNSKKWGKCINVYQYCQ